jgi:hypothetical protein
VASSASREESEEMYSGTSSVLDDFFKEQIKAKRGKEENMKHEITWRTRNKSRKNSPSNRTLLR